MKLSLTLSRNVFLLLTENNCLLLRSLKMFVPIDWKEFALLTTFKLPEMANLVFLSWTELAFVKYADKVVGRDPKEGLQSFDKWGQ